MTNPAIGSLIEAFRKVYGLSTASLFDEYFRHDAIHVMTGLGTSCYDEMRNAVPHYLLLEQGESDDIGIEKYMLSVRKSVNKDFCTAIDNERRSGKNAAKLAAFEAQIRTQPVTAEEMRELMQLSAKMDEAILALTGKRYRLLTMREIAALDASRLDFLPSAFEIRNRWETAGNKVVDLQIMQAFNAASVDLNGASVSHIAGRPWRPQLAGGLA